MKEVLASIYGGTNDPAMTDLKWLPATRLICAILSDKRCWVVSVTDVTVVKRLDDATDDVDADAEGQRTGHTSRSPRQVDDLQKPRMRRARCVRSDIKGSASNREGVHASPEAALSVTSLSRDVTSRQQRRRSARIRC